MRERVMKKAVWISFGAATVGVNLAAEAVEYFTTTDIVPLFRVMLILDSRFQQLLAIQTKHLVETPFLFLHQVH